MKLTRALHYITLFSLLGFCLANCQQKKKSSDDTKKSQKIFIVKDTKLKSVLYFNGIVSPLHTTSITTPIAGFIQKKYVDFGEKIKKGVPLFIIDANASSKNYSSTLTAYLKAKDQFNVEQNKFSGTQKLWQDGLVSRNSYESEKSTLNNQKLSFLQAEKDLIQLSKKMHLTHSNNLQALSFAHMQAVNKALQNNYNDFTVHSEASGILLRPPNEDKKTALNVGSEVKQGQLLALIGDEKGLTINVNISEIAVNTIRKGQKAQVTGVAFPHYILNAYVKQVNNQADGTSTSNNAPPTFTAQIVVPHLTKKEKQIIKIGMSAKVAIIGITPHVFLIPIDAIIHKNDHSLVKKITPKGNTIEVTVTTGQTTQNKVVINSGLQTGDKIIYHENDH